MDSWISHATRLARYTVPRCLWSLTTLYLYLSITQGNTSITQAGGKPLHITSPNSLGSYVSENFCLPRGAWTVKMDAPNGTHPEMASYGNDSHWASNPECVETGDCRGDEIITDEPFLDYAWCNFAVDLLNPEIYPFAIYWGIFSSGWREEAVKASTGGLDTALGLNFLYENRFKKAWAYTGDWQRGAYDRRGAYVRKAGTSLEDRDGGYLLGEQMNIMVPAVDRTCWTSDYHDGYYGPCPRTKAGDKVYNRSRLIGSGVVECWTGEPVPPQCVSNCTYNGGLWETYFVSPNPWYGPCNASDANSLM